MCSLRYHKLESIVNNLIIEKAIMKTVQLKNFQLQISFYKTLKYQRWSLKTLLQRIFVGPQNFVRRHKSWNNVSVFISLSAIYCFSLFWWFLGVADHQMTSLLACYQPLQILIWANECKIFVGLSVPTNSLTTFDLHN